MISVMYSQPLAVLMAYSHCRWEGSCLYKAPPKRVAYSLQESLKEELDGLQKQQIIVLLNVDGTSEWCNSFFLVPKANGKARLYLDLARLNKVQIRPIHRGLTLNDILSGLTGVKYLTFIDVSSRYHDLKFDEQSSYLTVLLHPLCRYRYIWLPFNMASAGNMFHRKMDKLFQGLPNMFGIAYDISIAGLDELGRDHDATLNKVLKICRQVNVKFSKDKCLFRCTRIPFFWWGNILIQCEPTPYKGTYSYATTQMQIGIAVIPRYTLLLKFSPMNAEVCVPLQVQTSVKPE